MHKTMKPHMKATVVAICGPSHISGCASLTCLMIWATVRDMTATGPMDTSLEVAKNWKIPDSKCLPIEEKRRRGKCG